MSIPIITPSYTPLDQIAEALRDTSYVVINPDEVSRWLATSGVALQTFGSGWDDLPPDNFLKDGGRYRRRRHASFIVRDSDIEQVAHRAHYQPLEYNALHGGMLRLFEPMRAESLEQPVFSVLLRSIAQVCSSVKGARPWYVEAHQFRIDTTDGIGRPTPEGAHRDGVDFVAILLVDRVNIKGGESRIFAVDGADGKRFTLLEPWTLVILDDQRVIHETTPIQPIAVGGHRDTLVLTFRSSGFLEAN
jgi:hypothetical protein